MSNNGELTRMYAPPSYDVVVSMDEQPPPYESDSSGSDIEDVAFIESTTSCACVRPEFISSETTDNIRNKQIAKSKNQPTVRVTSAIVVCDIDGNNLPSCSADGGEDPSLLQQTNYHLASTASPCERPENELNGHANGLPGKGISSRENGLKPSGMNGHANGLPHKGINGHSSRHLSTEIEVLSSEDDNTCAKDMKRMKKSRSDGDVKRSKSNGHARVNYSRSPSRQGDSARIEFTNTENDKVDVK